MGEFYKFVEYWEGSYERSSVDTRVCDVVPDLKYHAVVINQPNGRRIVVVPIFWLESRGRYVLYPHPDYNIQGMYPFDWTETMFNRRRFPSTKFVEYPVDDFITEDPVSFEEANKITDDFESGVDPNNFSGTDRGYISRDEAGEHSRSVNSLVQSSPIGSEIRNLDIAREYSNERSSRYYFQQAQEESPKTYTALTTVCNKSSNDHFARRSSTPLRTTNTTSASASGPSESRNMIGKQITPVRSFSPISDFPTTPNIPRRNAPRKLIPGGNNSSAREEDVEEEPIPNQQGFRQQAEKRTSSEVFSPAPTRNVIKEISSQSFRHQMLELVKRGVKLLEEQQGPTAVQERVINENARHFESVLKANISFPIKHPQQIEDLNESLNDVELSVAMCGAFIMRLKSIVSRDQIAKSLIGTVFTKQLCCSVQWKKRGTDKRPMIGHLINLIAVFGVIITTVLQNNNQPGIHLSKLIAVIQQARRALAFESENKEVEDGIEATSQNKADRQTHVAIDNRMDQLQEAILRFKLKD